MTDYEERAREILKSEPISNYDRDRLAPKMAQAIAEVRREAIEECAKVADNERVRQIKADKFERMMGQDTAFVIGQTIRSLPGASFRGGERT